MTEEVLTTREVIAWWELRRLIYNGLLLLIGLAAIVGMELLMDPVIPLGEDAVEPAVLALGVVIYGITANICYTSGWIIELWWRNAGVPAARERGQYLFRAGLWISCTLTTVPFWFGLLFRMFSHGHRS